MKSSETLYIGGDIQIDMNGTYTHLFGGGYSEFKPEVSNADSIKYYYYTKDHLGNIRNVLLNDNGTMTELQHTSYYPFGGIIADTLLTKGRDVQDRTYNGKEQDFSNNLFWLDYGARQYDPTRGQFTTPDPLAEKYYGWNYYTYCVNNPMNAIDPDGRLVRYVEGTIKYIYYNGAFYTNAKLCGEDGEFKGDKVTQMSDNMRKVLNALVEMSKSQDKDVKEVYETVTDIHNTQNLHDIEITNKGKSFTHPNGNDTTTSLNFEDSKKGRDFKTCGLTFFQLFVHEIKHAYDLEVGIATAIDDTVKGIGKDEFSTVYFENLVRPSGKQRTTYGGISINDPAIPHEYRMVIMKNKGGKKHPNSTKKRKK